MRPSLLKTFLAVAHSQSLSRAAAEVHLAQSSVSDQIQSLEAELGTDLLKRSKLGVELTPAGKTFQPYAEKILALMDEARASVESRAGKTVRALTIGALETIASAVMPQWLQLIRGDHPDIDLRVRIASSGEISRKLEGGEIDVGLCFDTGALDERFLKRAVSAEPLVVVASPSERPQLLGASLPALASKSFVATEAGCVFRRLFDQAFVDAGVAAPHLTAEVGSIRGITRLVAAGAGLALLPRLAVIEALERGELIEMPWPGPIRTVSLVAICRRRRVQPPALKLLFDYVDTAFKQVKPSDAHLRHAGSSPS